MLTNKYWCTYTHLRPPQSHANTQLTTGIHNDHRSQQKQLQTTSNTTHAPNICISNRNAPHMCSQIHIDARIHIYVHHKVMQTHSITTSIKINPQKQKNNCRPLPTSRNHQIYRLVAKVHHTHVRKHIFIYVSIEMSTANRPANLTFCTSQFEFQTFFCFIKSFIIVQISSQSNLSLKRSHN